jgi:hypothetical protein
MSICRKLLDKLIQMGLRGPKPVDVKHLQGEAMQWACFLYIVRDGVPGWIQRGKWVRYQPTGSAKWVRGRQPIEAPILIPVSAASQRLPKRMTAEKGWVIFRPIMPKPAIWEQLKRARTVPQIRGAARGIGRLQTAFVSSTPWGQNPAGAFRHYAAGILAAKRLPNYPKTNRPRSDDKRVEFLAKTMAGLTLGLAAITALKRLSHWRWPKDTAEKGLKEFVERSKGQF